jgi:ABC-2 type transport system permease protein
VNLWRLEFLRLWRTQRWLILLAVYGAFGILGPLTARYLPDIVENMGGEEAVRSLPPMTPADGMAQYIGNAQQFGLLAVVFVAAGALSIDSNKEMSIFLRTRTSVRNILTPRFVMTCGAAISAYLVGAVIAYVGTGLLLAWLSPGGVIVGSLFQALYLILAVALTGFVASFIGNVPGTALLTVGLLIFMALIGLLPAVAPWLPSELVGVMDVLIRGGDFDFWRPMLTTIVLVGLLGWGTVERFERREV